MRVFICDRDHPHHGEVGTLTGEIASVLGTPTERQAIAMTPQDSTEARIAEIRDTYLVTTSLRWFRDSISYLFGRLHEQAQRHKFEIGAMNEVLLASEKRTEAAESALAAARVVVAQCKRVQMYGAADAAREALDGLEWELTQGHASPGRDTA